RYRHHGSGGCQRRHWTCLVQHECLRFRPAGAGSPAAAGQGNGLHAESSSYSGIIARAGNVQPAAMSTLAIQPRSTVERKLFGTDGIRGVAGAFPLDPETTFAIGRALGHHIVRSNRRARAVIGQDTRESGQTIADSVATGLAVAGVEVQSAGVITTPGIAYLARAQKFDAGIVISASHNPWTDNGIKVFGGDGYKLPDELELEIEHEIFTVMADESGEIKVPATQQGTL